MKKLLLGFAFLSSISSFAGPMNSIALQGIYELNRVVKNNNPNIICPNLLSISVSKDIVIIKDKNSENILERFFSDREGLKKRQGDIGPWRFSNLRFNKRSVKETDTQPLSIAGYIKFIRYAKLNLRKQLVIGEKSTLIPAGLFIEDDDYKCVYDRLITE